MALFISSEVVDRIERMEVPFNSQGMDPYGVSKKALARSLSALSFLYKRYFRVSVLGIENVPPRGRAMLVGNHSGGVAVDGAMVIASMFWEMNPPRLAQGMADKFINRVPFMGEWANRTGHLTGLPETAERLLHDDRLLMIFPEGARGTAKLYHERHSLVEFGTGFVRLAMKTRTPIVPFGFLGGGEAIPTIMNSYALGALFGAPYLPITPYFFALPLPVSLEVHYGEPLFFEGTGTEDDEIVAGHVERVKAAISALMSAGINHRKGSEVAR